MRKSKKLIIYGIALTLVGVCLTGCTIKLDDDEYDKVKETLNSANVNEIVEDVKEFTKIEMNEAVKEEVEESTKEDDDAKIIMLGRTAITNYEKLLPYTSKTIGPMPYLLSVLGLDTEENLDKIVSGKNTEEYIKTNTKYSDFKNEVLKYVTEEIFEENFSLYTNMDGYVGVQNVAGGYIPVTIIKIELESKKDDEYVFTVTYRDEEMYSHYLNGEISEVECNTKGTISCKYVDGVFVVCDIVD